MKNILLFIAAALVIISCQKQTPNQEKITTDLGYSAFKYGQVTQTLYGGQTIDVGTVTIWCDDDDDMIMVKYQTNEGWYLKETHVFVGGDGSEVPVNKPGNPRIGQFPYSTDHGYNGLTEFTYETIYYEPLAEEPFVIATHAVVYSGDGQEETAWSYNESANDDDENTSSLNTPFPGKRWGWFQSYSFNGQLPAQNNLLYVTQYDEDGVLHIFLINLDNGDVDEISQEEFLAGIGADIDGSAWDPNSNQFFFVSEAGNELWATDFNQDIPSSLIGTLEGIAIDGTFLNDTYYYIDVNNQIWAVTFDADMNMTQTPIGSINSDMDVIDIAVSPDGQSLYFVINNNGTSDLVVYNINDGSLNNLANLGDNAFQIAFDADGDLVGVEVTPEDDNSIVHDIDQNTGEVENSTNVDVDVEDVVVGPRI